MRRSKDSILAVWPEYKSFYGRWFMQELVYKDDLPPRWRDRLIPGEADRVFSDTYPNRETAVASADALNPSLRDAVSTSINDPILLRSIQLKIDKALESKRRLQEEEALMLAEAIRRHAGDPPPDPVTLQLAPEAELHRQDLADQLNAMPYLSVVQVGWEGGRWRKHLLLYKDGNGGWSKPYTAGKKAAVTSERAKIADGYDLPASAHWGKTKAQIRQILLPRANELLQLASVKRLLAEAFARGERVLVSNGIVFWYEDDGGLRWQVKETGSNTEADGATLWREGTIRSTNHGRLVILPYIKEDGEKVCGHRRR